MDASLERLGRRYPHRGSRRIAVFWASAKAAKLNNQIVPATAGTNARRYREGAWGAP
jgi:hypothetical protein